MIEPPQTTQESRELLADFGELMLEIQSFEFALLGLVQAQGEDLRRSPDYRPFIEELFTLTAGQLRRRANINDPELGDLLENTVILRNRLVHGWLIYAGMDGLTGVMTTAQQREELQIARRAIHDARLRLTAVWEEELGALEDDDLTPDEVIKTWRARRRESEE